MAAQRKSGAKVGTAKGRGSSDIRLPGEKSVRSTSESVPVKRAGREAEPDGPTDPNAIDRRRQIVGTDDPGAAGTRARRGKAAR
jgi:hypothetical protein